MDAAQAQPAVPVDPVENIPFWNQAEGIFNQASENLGINWLNRQVVDFAGLFPEILRDITITLWKVIPLVIILFILPNSIVYTAIVLYGIITVIRPGTIPVPESLQVPLCQGFGFWSAFKAVGNAAMVSLSTTPEVCVLAATIHFVAFVVCFAASRIIQIEEAAAKAKAEEAEKEEEELDKMEIDGEAAEGEADGGLAAAAAEPGIAVQ